MAEEDYQVMISGKQYKQLLAYKDEVKKLKENLIRSKQANLQKDQIIKTFEKQIMIKKQEILYLESLIEDISFNKSKDNQFDTMELDQTLFQILGQSVQFNKQVLEQEIFQEKSTFPKKFEKYVLIIQQIMKKLQSQQELISNFHHKNAINYEAINKNGNIVDELKRDGQKSINNAKTLNSFIHKTDRNEIQGMNLQNKTKAMEEENKCLKNDNNKLAFLIAYYNKRFKELYLEKTKINFSSQKDKELLVTMKENKLHQIKHLINSYMTEIEADFKNIKGLNEKEIGQLMQSERQNLISYISESPQNKKK